MTTSNAFHLTLIVVKDDILLSVLILCSLLRKNRSVCSSKFCKKYFRRGHFRELVFGLQLCVKLFLLGYFQFCMFYDSWLS